jgi:hypothetical protein
MKAVHVCGIPQGPYRYGGYWFEIHPYCGPSELKANGEPVNRAPSRKFISVWETFDGLRQADKDLYATDWNGKPLNERGR